MQIRSRAARRLSQVRWAYLCAVCTFTPCSCGFPPTTWSPGARCIQLINHCGAGSTCTRFISTPTGTNIKKTSYIPHKYRFMCGKRCTQWVFVHTPCLYIWGLREMETVNDVWRCLFTCVTDWWHVQSVLCLSPSAHWNNLQDKQVYKMDESELCGDCSTDLFSLLHPI